MTTEETTITARIETDYDLEQIVEMVEGLTVISNVDLGMASVSILEGDSGRVTLITTANGKSALVHA
ncbi:MAG: hypothetical protein HRT93_07890 [Piscirickettsiaceae bacterium]|nr:hypothetical protein [Piscirickettsiaceae bacterium]